MIVNKTYLTILFITLSGVAFGQTDSVKCRSLVDSLTNKTIYEFVDKMPEPEGGMQSLMDVLTKNLEYRTQATVHGKIYVGFIVDVDGKIIGKRILKDPMGNDFGEQILENVDKINWIPGSCDGIKVPVFVRFPMIIDVK